MPTESRRRGVAHRYFVTIVLIMINIIIYFAEEMSGGSTNNNVALTFGAAFTPFIMQGQWWRLFTAMFVHFGISHIANNMLSLFILGRIVEQYYGHFRFLIIYLVSGLGGNILTVILELHSGNFGLSAGASGAIFGIMSAFVLFAIKPATRRFFPLKNVLAGVFFSIMPGFFNSGISISAHIGGFITGIILAFLLDPYKKRQ